MQYNILMCHNLLKTIVLPLIFSGVFCMEAAATDINRSTGSFNDGKSVIHIDQYLPSNKDRVPAVILLYGGSRDKDDGGFYENTAVKFAKRGYAVFLVHYFGRTDDLSRLGYRFTSGEQVQVWKQTISKSIQYVRLRPEVNSEKVGMMGYSLGATLAVCASAGYDLQALVEFSGQAIPDCISKPELLPPTLILHGFNDRQNSVEEAMTLKKVFSENYADYDIKIYAEGDHYSFYNSKNVIYLDGFYRSLKFFDERLKT